MTTIKYILAALAGAFAGSCASVISQGGAVGWFLFGASLGCWLGFMMAACFAAGGDRHE